MSLKVIAGRFKGRNLITPAGFETRPLLARVKKSLFDILTPRIVKSAFLDLFAGVGSVGIEALSRGAKKVVFVESNSKCVEIIEDNLKILSVSNEAEVIQSDATKPDFLDGKFDIIFIGPPYKMKILANVIGKVGGVLAKNGIVIGQHQFREELPNKIEEFSLFRQEKYGDMRLSFYKIL
jgi:16S rRNA (guanine966-N2)-methyltransferase